MNWFINEFSLLVNTEIVFGSPPVSPDSHYLKRRPCLRPNYPCHMYFSCTRIQNSTASRGLIVNFSNQNIQNFPKYVVLVLKNKKDYFELTANS